MGDTPERQETADRRDFLRQIAKDGVKSASSIFGVVGALRREAGALADELRIEDPLADLVDDAPQPERRAAEAALDLALDAGLVPLGKPTPAAAFASPVRDDARGLILLDVRALPAQILERRADTAGALAAALAAGVMAPGPVRALAAGLSLAAVDASDAPARPARIQAAAASLRNAAPLSDALRDEVTTLLAAAPGTLGQLVAARATLRVVAYAALAEKIAATLRSCNTQGATVATGPGLGATYWGDGAPGHEALRRAGATKLLIAEGPSVDPRGVTRLGGLDAADAVRLNLPATLMSEAQLGLAIARGEACALLLSSEAVAEDGSAVIPAGGVALAAAAAARGIPILLVALQSKSFASDAATLLRRVAEAEATELHAEAGGSVASRSVSAGVAVHAPRYELLAAGVAERL